MCSIRSTLKIQMKWLYRIQSDPNVQRNGISKLVNDKWNSVCWRHSKCSRFCFDTSWCDLLCYHLWMLKLIFIRLTLARVAFFFIRITHTHTIQCLCFALFDAFGFSLYIYPLLFYSYWFICAVWLLFISPLEAVVFPDSFFFFHIDISKMLFFKQFFREKWWTWLRYVMHNWSTTFYQNAMNVCSLFIVYVIMKNSLNILCDRNQ